MALADGFNHSAFSRLLNSPGGRLAAGAAFLVSGVLLAPAPLGIAFLAWSALPLSAGAFDVCWISAALGGPLAGRRIRDLQTV